MFEKTVYISRRMILKRRVGNGIILLLGNDECSINFQDNCYPFRQDSCFLYYFGLQKPGLFGVMDIDDDTETIYGEDQTLDDIVFTGCLPALKDLADSAGIHSVSSISALSRSLERALSRGRTIHYLPAYRPEHEKKLHALLNIPCEQLPEKASVILIKAIVEQRSVKTNAEVEEIERAVNITADMQLMAMNKAASGMTESQLAASLTEIALSYGGTTSFPPIVTVQGQVLHNFFRGNKLSKNKIVLCDCGAETAMNYSGDLTRSFPVENQFSSKQREIYEIVLNAYRAAVDLLKPDILFYDVHCLASEKIAEGLKQVGLMKGDAAEAVRAGAVTLFFPCGLGHFMGMDVHDMENLGEEYAGYTETMKKSREFGFKSLRLGRSLEAGFVLTVEPGIYFIPELIDLRKSQRKYLDFINYDKLEGYTGFGGIRIEDDYVITKSGSRRLGKYLPTTVQEIENIRQMRFARTLTHSL